MASALFSPIRIRGTEFRNRLWVAPMTLFAVEERDGVPRHTHLVHLGTLAAGGAGAIVVESTAVVPEGRVSPQDVGIWNDAQRDAWAEVVSVSHSFDTPIGIQLGHGGRKSATARSWEPQVGTLPPHAHGWSTVGPSPVPYRGYADPRELTLDEIRALEDAYVSAVVRSRDAGFDFVELHAAHGFLLHQFLSPLSNHRTDEYGGPLENRARLLLDIVRRSRGVLGERPILIRFSATDWVEGGWTEEDTAVVAGWCVEAGADFFDVSTGGLVPDAVIPTFPGYQVPFAERLRATGVGTSAVGLILTPRQAEEIVASGRADVVMVGREFLRDPHFAFRAAVALGAEVDYHPPQYAGAYR